MRARLALLAGLACLGAKNLLRHRIRSALTALVIVICAASYICLDSMLTWAGQESVQNLILYHTGIGQIMTKQHFANRKRLELEYSFELSPELEQFLAREKLDYTAHIEFPARLIFRIRSAQLSGSQADERASINARIVALDARKDRQVLAEGLDAAGGSGKWLSQNASAAEIVLGKFMARNMELAVGDKILLSTRDSYGSLVTEELTVAGILDSSDPTVNRSGAYISMTLADWILDLQGEKGTKISYLTVKPQGFSGVLGFSGVSGASLRGRKFPIHDAELQAYFADLNTKLAQQFPSLQAVPWQKISAVLIDTMTGKSASSYVTLLLFFVISAAGIVNTVSMALLERRKEIATLAAFGMGEGAIRAAFIWENLLLGAISGLLGLGLGLLLNLGLIHWGIDYSKVISSEDMDIGYQLSSFVMRGVWHTPVLVAVPLVSALLTALSTLHPTRAVLRLNIREALQ